MEFSLMFKFHKLIWRSEFCIPLNLRHCVTQSSVMTWCIGVWLPCGSCTCLCIVHLLVLLDVKYTWFCLPMIFHWWQSTQHIYVRVRQMTVSYVNVFMLDLWQLQKTACQGRNWQGWRKCSSATKTLHAKVSPHQHTTLTRILLLLLPTP